MKKIAFILTIILIVATAFFWYTKPVKADLVRAQAVNGKNTTFASSVVTGAFASPLTNPSLIVCAAEYDAGAANSGNTPTDTAVNSWTKAKTVNVAGTFELEVWYALNTHTTSSEKVTMTDTNGGVDSTSVCEEWTGAATASPVDRTPVSNTGSGTALTTGSMATSNANDFLFEVGASAVSGNHFVLAGSYTNLNQTSTTFSNIGDATQIVSATGNYTGTLTNNNVSWAMILIAFQQAAGGGSTPANPPNCIIAEQTIIAGQTICK